MKWSLDHDSALLREISLLIPCVHKKRSSKRGKVWDNIAKSLNSLETSKFYVTQRFVRDRYLLLEKKYKKKVSKNEKASGISSEESEVDQAMDNIIIQFDDADVLHER